MDSEKNNLIKKLNELKDAVEEGDKNKIKDIINWFHKDLERNKQLLKLVTSGSQCITQTDLIIAVCRTRGKEAVTIFNLLKEYDILDQLPVANFDDPEVKKQRTEAFKHALELDTFCMVEILYEYWCGDLYWIVKSPQSIETHDIIKKIITLRESLEDARIVTKIENQTQVVEFHSLLTFNTFQHKLYSSLSRLGSGESPEDTATMVIDVLSIYEHYSDLEKVRLPKTNQKDELKLKALLDDVTSIRQKSFVNIAYEVYFQKLDFNVAWLVMENSFVLKNHLKQRFNKRTRYFTQNPQVENFYRNEVSLYKESESGLFHYIYRTYEKWRLYIPTNSQTTEDTDHTGIHDGKKINLVNKYDKYKLFYAPLLFLERENFKKCLNNLKIIWKKHVISEDPEKNWIDNQTNNNDNTITTLLDDNYLTATMYMSDYYSLKKIVYYIEAIEGTNGIHVLMIERALQVIGEMLKNTKSSNHIMESTKSLLHIALSVETLEYIHDIREFLSHANKGRVSTRINIANDQQQMFAKIKKELIFIKTKIYLVLDINKYLFDKSLLEEGLRLLDERIETWSSSHVEVYQHVEKHGKQSFSDPYLQELTGLGTQLLEEIPQVVDIKKHISFKIQSAKTSISDKIDSFILENIGNIRQTLQLITDNQTYVKQINPQLHKLCESNADVLTIDDNGENIKYILEHNIMAKWLDKNNTVVIDLETLNKIKDFSSHWDHITTMLSFCLNNSQLFEPEDPIRQANVNDKDTVENILSKLEGKDRNKKYTSGHLENYSFSGIEKLHNISKNSKASNLCRIVRQELIKCLISRVNLLKDTFGYPQHIPETDITPSFQHLRRFKSDKKFRLELEMILADIGNILISCKIKKIMIKSAKLQRDIDLRNVLHHGNPFIEVIGDVYDTYDLPSELLSNALMFANDGLFIEALFKLFQDEITVRTIKNLENKKINKLDDDLKAFYEQFQDNDRWKTYLQLIKI